ncbi:hypothetical protein HK096_011405 [Nowakowskiella sp. JEL0078]|nr:hypothetical protein HK096_011405 [Nowakowskiella sp. JEL0078]
MFAAGRKTCSLSHARIGDRDTALVFRTFVTPSQKITDTLIAECRSVFEDGVLSLYATPKVMESVALHYSSYESLRGSVTAAWDIFMRGINTPSGNGESYVPILTFAWIPRAARKKGGIVILRGIDEEDDGEVPVAGEYSLYGFLWARWDPPQATFEILQMGARMMAMQSLTVVKELLRHALSSVSRSVDGSTDGVKHLYMHSRRDNARLQLFMEKVGFVVKDVYTRSHPGINGDVFRMREDEKRDMINKLRRLGGVDERGGVDALLERQVVTHVMNSEVFLDCRVGVF